MAGEVVPKSSTECSSWLSGSFQSEKPPWVDCSQWSLALNQSISFAVPLHVSPVCPAAHRCQISRVISSATTASPVEAVVTVKCSDTSWVTSQPYWPSWPQWSVAPQVDAPGFPGQVMVPSVPLGLGP